MPSSKFYNPATITWYPSSEHLILAIGEGGHLTLWNVEVFCVSFSLPPQPPLPSANNNSLLRKLCFVENDILFVIKF